MDYAKAKNIGHDVPITTTKAGVRVIAGQMGIPDSAKHMLNTCSMAQHSTPQTPCPHLCPQLIGP